jgi:DNA-binding transcriptional ArsR family regulator
MLDSLRRFKAGIFRALAHPLRVGIVEYLQYGEQTIERLSEKLGCDAATLTPHLAALSKGALITFRKGPGGETCCIRDEAFLRVLKTMRDYYFAHLTEALKLLHEEEQEMQGGKG